MTRLKKYRRDFFSGDTHCKLFSVACKMLILYRKRFVFCIPVHLGLLSIFSRNQINHTPLYFLEPGKSPASAATILEFFNRIRQASCGVADIRFDLPAAPRSLLRSLYRHFHSHRLQDQSRNQAVQEISQFLRHI